MTCSIALGATPSKSESLEGAPLKNQTWATGVAKLICPILSRLTLDWVTSTPHLSQTTPLYLILLYLPQ